MPLNPPLITYNSIKINNVNIELDSECRASYNPPFNKIDIEMTCANCAVSYFEIRVTDEDADYDIGVGRLPSTDINNLNSKAFWTGLRANYTHNISFYITPESFPMEEGQTSKTFRVSLYAKSEEDGSWDVSYLLFTVDGAQFTLLDGDALCVLTTREAPKN